MPDATRIEKWISQIEVDYYSYFIKAWIPFNAWYRHNYPQIDSDRAVINEIKRTGNQFRSSIVALLNNQSVEGQMFRAAIADLHNALTTVPVECRQKYKDDYVISLSEICIENNPTDKIQDTRNGITYFVQRDKINGSIILTVKSGATTKYIKNQQMYSEQEIITDDKYHNDLSLTQQRTLLSYYKQINPWYPCSLLFDASRDTRTNNIKCGSIDFATDRELFAKGIIECLYLLRNTLLHGELNPTKETFAVYKSAYTVLSSIVKKLS